MIPTPTANITSPPDFKTWAASRSLVLANYDAGRWTLTDWAVTGVERFGDSANHILANDAERHLFRQALLVGRKFPRDKRHARLSWWHHLEVVALPEADAHTWLTKAEKNAWPTKDLRTEIRRALAIDGPDTDRRDAGWLPTEIAHAFMQGMKRETDIRPIDTWPQSKALTVLRIFDTAGVTTCIEAIRRRAGR
jgi:hypothetical protein